MIVRTIAIGGVVVLAAFIWLIVDGRQGTTRSPNFPPPPEVLTSSVLGFSNDTADTRRQVAEANGAYERVRLSAIERATAAAEHRNNAVLGGHIASALGLFTALAIALVTAVFGTQDGNGSSSFPSGTARRALLALAGISTFLVGASDRLDAYASSEADRVNGVVGTVTNEDSVVAHALSPSEVSDAANNLQASLLKF
jgi:hypothetical protein